MPRTISPSGRKFIEGFEGFVPYPYDDKVAPRGGKEVEWTGGPLRGTATIGYGHTNSAKHPLKVVPGLLITEADADAILDVDLSDVIAEVDAAVKVPITQGEADALYSFDFNCGAGCLHMLIDNRLNKGDYAATRAALALYNKSGGEYMAGLARRRAGEQALWDATTADIPTEPVHHSADVDVPLPPLPRLRPPVPATPWWQSIVNAFLTLINPRRPA